VPLRHTIASSALASQHSLKWLDGVLDAYAASPLALAHDGYATSGARLLGTTSLRFALHGWQRKGPDTFSDIKYLHQPIACPDSPQHTDGSLTLSHHHAAPGST